MGSIKRTDILIIFFFIAYLAVLSACNTNFIVSDKPVPESGMGKILIMPVMDMAAVYGEKISVRCPICGKIFLTGKADPEASRMLTEQVFKILKKNGKYNLLFLGMAEGVMTDLLAENTKDVSERDLLVKAGRQVQAYAVMAGYLYRFKERIGKRYSVESPASVAFGFHLVRVSDGRVLWGGNYDVTQRALSENILQIGTFLKRKGKWVTVEEMTKEGLEKIFKSFRHVTGN